MQIAPAGLDVMDLIVITWIYEQRKADRRQSSSQSSSHDIALMNNNMMLMNANTNMTFMDAANTAAMTATAPSC